MKREKTDSNLRTAFMLVASFLFIAALSLAATDVSLISSLSTFPAIEVEPGSAVTGLLIDQNYDARGLEFDMESTSAPFVYGDQNAGAAQMHLGDIDSPTASYLFDRDVASATTAGPVVLVNQDNAGDDQGALSVKQDGTFFGGSFDCAQDSDYCVYIDSNSSQAYARFGDVTDAGGTFKLVRNAVSSRTAGPVMSLTQDNAGDDQPTLTIQQDGGNTHIRLLGSGACFNDGFMRNTTGIYVCFGGTPTKLS